MCGLVPGRSALFCFEIGDVGPTDFATTSGSVLSTNRFTYGTEDGPVTAEVESSAAFAKTEYYIRARALTAPMFLINLMLTVFSMITEQPSVGPRGAARGGFVYTSVIYQNEVQESEAIVGGIRSAGSLIIDQILS